MGSGGACAPAPACAPASLGVPRPLTALLSASFQSRDPPGREPEGGRISVEECSPCQSRSLTCGHLHPGPPGLPAALMREVCTRARAWWRLPPDLTIKWSPGCVFNPVCAAQPYTGQPRAPEGVTRLTSAGRLGHRLVLEGAPWSPHLRAPSRAGVSCSSPRHPGIVRVCQAC